MSKLKIGLLFLGLTMLLLVVPAAQAGAPEKGSGPFEFSRADPDSIKVTDDGNIVLTFTSTVTFEGDVDGVLIVDAIFTIHNDGTFNLLTHSGEFIGSIHGREGTALLKIGSVSGVGPEGNGCCYEGMVQLTGTGGALEGYSGKIDLSFQSDGKTYTSNSHFH
jgi:hypothetical protein